MWNLSLRDFINLCQEHQVLYRGDLVHIQYQEHIVPMLLDQDFLQQILEFDQDQVHHQETVFAHMIVKLTLLIFTQPLKNSQTHSMMSSHHLFQHGKPY